MPKDWSLKRLKAAKLSPRQATYEVSAIPSSPYEASVQESHPQLFSFEALSIGDSNGQALFIPLDESSEETAKLILAAIAAYQVS